MLLVSAPARADGPKPTETATKAAALPPLPVIDFSQVRASPDGTLVLFPPEEASKVGELSVKGPLWRERALLEEERADHMTATATAAKRLIRVQEGRIQQLSRNNTLKDILLVGGAVLLGGALGWGISEAMH
jgi:hypothetical protein